MLQQNLTSVSNLLASINASVMHDLDVIAMFDGTVNGTTVMDVHGKLENISATISNLNISSYNYSFQALQETIIEANSLQNDFHYVRDNITESLMRANQTIQLLLIAENLLNSTTTENTLNMNNLSLLSAGIPLLENDLQAQLNRLQSYEAEINSTYLRAMTLRDDVLTQTEQEILNSSIAIEQLHNQSNISFELTNDALVAVQHLNVRIVAKSFLYLSVKSWSLFCRKMLVV